jgi:large subunit ribosomal protein L15
MKLEKIPRRKNRILKDKRLGRGYGSGVGGHTVGRGQKGQKSRSGHKSMVLFEGGNLPFYKKIPKYRGFSRPGKIVYKAVNLANLESNFNDGDEISVDSLAQKGLIHKNEKNVKILGQGSLKKKVVVKGLKVSETARKAILKAKGEIK